jgi:hypothetical protein
MKNKIVSKIEELKELAAILKTDREAAEKAAKDRDMKLRKYLESVCQLASELVKDQSEARGALRKKYGELRWGRAPAEFLMRFTYPKLEPRTRWKWLAVVHCGLQDHGPAVSIDKTLMTYGGINGCVKEAKRRKTAKRKERLAAEARASSSVAPGKPPKIAKPKEKATVTISQKGKSHFPSFRAKAPVRKSTTAMTAGKRRLGGWGKTKKAS